MNKRIQEIVKQSITDTSGKWLSVDNAEKLAEMIVQECINELEAHKKCDPYTGELIDSDWNDITQFQIINIKEHFGVE